MRRIVDVMVLAMLNKYEKRDAPLWQRRLVLIIGGLSGATFLLFAVWAVLLFIET